jgi:NADH-quinone oxidoreductase subunit M
MSGVPMLSLMIFTLPLMAVLIWLLDSSRARWVALLATLLELILASLVVMGFDSADPGFQYVERIQWMPTLNIQYLVGVDGISVLFLPLTVLLFLGVILASWNNTRTSLPRLFFSLLLLLESIMLGVFCALDTILFFFFWEFSLIPLYFLISLWGVGPNRRFAAVKYTLFMLAGGLPLLFGILLLAFNGAELSAVGIPYGFSFDYIKLLELKLPHEIEVLVFFLLLAGFAFKIPVFPFHTWLPAVAQEGPVAVVALITGLKLGAYGLIRFVVPLAPTAAQEYHWLLAGLGVIGIIYGAVAAMAQSNLRGMLAFSSMSHVGLVVLGIATFSVQGVQGALFQLLNFTVVAGGIFILTGFLHHRIGSTDLISLGGAAKSMPLLASFFFLFGLAGMGVPATSGFPAEFLILLSALNTHTGAGLAALFGVVLGAGYFLSYYRRAFLGPVSNTVVMDALDLRRRELLLVSVLAVLILYAGFYPDSVLDFTSAASENWVGHLAPASD